MFLGKGVEDNSNGIVVCLYKLNLCNLYYY